MKQCPYCGYSNYDEAAECRKCQASFAPQTTTAIQKSFWCGPEKARVIRDKALAILVLGLLIKVYWGGIGPWPVIDNPTLASLRGWVEPLLIYGGALLYGAGWVLRWV
jgi:hypothetical protein